MADEFNKSEDATPFKLEEARKKGQVGKSSEFSSMAGLVASLVTLCISLPHVANVLEKATVDWMSNVHLLIRDPRLALLYVENFIDSLLQVSLPIILVGAAASIIGTILHTGPVFSLVPISPDFSRLNPAQGLKKIFSRRALVEIAKLVIKLGVFAAVSYMVWRSFAGMILYSGGAGVGELIGNFKYVLVKLIFALLLVYVCFSLFDLWFSKREFSRQMRMSLRDVKDEFKRREGNPEIKSKRRRVYLDLIKQFASIANVKDADVIITNPTHVAVALKYRAKTMALPIVLAKGKGFFAFLIRKRAHRAGVLTMRLPLLARRLLMDATINSPIPLDCQQDVADVYKDVLRRPDCKVFK